MERLFKLNAPAVVSEIIDGEAVIMHLKSGNYYNTEHVGSQIWAWLEQGLSYRQMLDSMAARYPVARPELTAALDTFLAELVAQDLVHEVAAEPAKAMIAEPEPINGAARPFAAPVLSVYSDMTDLLLLDPIHDVDEVGWPKQKPQEA
jgi:Coenzyme PQQ synthesis protein D (PqqD)